MDLEAANLLGRRALWRAAQKPSEPLAAPEVALLRARHQIAGLHVLDHALAQRQ
jgi:hypothetical protein